MSQTMHNPQMEYLNDQKTARSPLVHTRGSSLIPLYGAYTSVRAKATAEIHIIATNF